MKVSRTTGRRITTRKLVAELLKRERVWTLEGDLYEGSPKQKQRRREWLVHKARFDREDAAKAAKARRYLRAKCREWQAKGCPDPMLRAITDLARSLRRKVEHLPYAMCPPEWTATHSRLTLKPGWWTAPERGRAARLARRKAWMKAHPETDTLIFDRSWPGRPEEVSANVLKARERAKKQRLREDTAFERRRLQMLAKRMGIAVHEFCPRHGCRFFRCDDCTSPRYPQHAGAGSYARKLREAIFGADAMNPRQDHPTNDGVGFPAFKGRKAPRDRSRGRSNLA